MHPISRKNRAVPTPVVVCCLRRFIFLSAVVAALGLFAVRPAGDTPPALALGDHIVRHTIPAPADPNSGYNSIKPFDDRFARKAYIAWVAADSAHQSPTFRQFWDRIEHDTEITVYAGWLLIASMQHQREVPTFRPDLRRAVDNILDSAEKARDPNWTMPVLLWWQYRYTDLLTDNQRRRVRHLLLNEKYWITDPGDDQRCYFTENHQIIYHVNEYLAGHLLPDDVFTVTGQSGQWHHNRGRQRIVQWMDWRARFGFSEFKSLGYSDVLLMILTTLREFAPDPTLRDRADAMIDLILTGYVLHSFRGNLAAAQGRGDAAVLIKGQEWMPSATGSILWGVGEHREVLAAGTIALALGGYEIPSVLQAIARDQHSTREISEREGLEVEEAAAWGIDPTEDRNIMFFWGNQQYCHPLVLDASMRALPWDKYYMAGRMHRARAVFERASMTGQPLPTDMDYTAVGRAAQYAYQTADYRLASVRDLRPGGRGFQQHVWQATLPGYAMAFSQNPYRTSPFAGPGYWKGHGVLPRVAQHRNLLIALHHIPDEPDLTQATHVYFPRWAFDEVRQSGHWLFGRKGNGYLAVYSHQPAHWREPDPAVVQTIHRFDRAAQSAAMASGYDWYSPGAQNVILCEMGSASEHGSFDQFVVRHENSTICIRDLHVEYASPTLGIVTFDWIGVFRVNGMAIDLKTNNRLCSPYGTVRFGDTRFSLSHQGWAHAFDLLSGVRISR